ncbi:MAG: UvrD-helicase domain-containing protein, partial [Alphaproteobacteria bacterium]|nr:UvrD-helicase domain-containing protein [Alphaproteobacteria bacterium]
MTDLHPATRHQNDASDPSGSTWLSANAGSGKTRVLTDRVARLLLQDVDPQNILCLTYTKAAASEMQNRLFKRLGEWAMLPSDKLRDELSSLGVEDGLDLGKARTLFARAIETPGGLKIQTIHSFCAALLRRFPVEAGVSPQFAEMDETAQARLIADVLNRMAETDGDAIGDIARIYRGETLEELAAQIAKHRDAFGATVQQDEIWAEYGLPANLSTADVYRLLRTPKTAHTIHRLIPVLAQGSVTDQKAGTVLAALDPARIDESDLLALESVLLFKGKAEVPFGPKIGKFPTAATRKARPDLAEAVDQLMEQVAEARHMRVGLSAAENTLALHRFAAAFLPAYEAEKRWRGWLDFDDLIGRTIALLSNPSVAAWVLFRLDGGIDHILVDEAQDTSPAQWRVVDLLAGEFGAGLGARENIRRTLFVVGDKKQSIYSFQGADAEAFDRMRTAFKNRLKPQGGLASRTLEFSFRSSRGVLDLVDRTFDGPAGQGLGLEVRHRAFHETMPGRVDLWPLVPKAEDPVDGDWTDPVDQTAPNHATAILSQHIADEIHRMIHDETVTIPTQGGGRKRVDEGDILILVQGRSGSGDLFHSLIRACKKKHLKVAGADRLRIGGELAVRDLRALLAFLALPEDSLSLAAALRSPLFGWSEEQLFNIAARRTERYLWEAIRKAD